jgi:hypothetical protein
VSLVELLNEIGARNASGRDLWRTVLSVNHGDAMKLPEGSAHGRHHEIEGLCLNASGAFQATHTPQIC